MPLQEEEDEDDRNRHQNRASHQITIAYSILSDVIVHPYRQRPHFPGRGKRQREEEFLPGNYDNEHGGGNNSRPAQGQNDLNKSPEWRSSVDCCSLFERERQVSQETAHHPNGYRQGYRYIGDD